MSRYAQMNPLKGQPPAEVPLTDPPLVRVIAQIRFPLMLSVEKPDFIAPFQEGIRAEYPVLRPEQSRSVVFSEKGVLDARSNTLWKFQDVNAMWSVTLAPDFLALDTGNYVSRDDFLDRFEYILNALDVHLGPSVIDRLGLRYIDRVVGEDLESLPKLVRPEVCGILSSPLALHAGQSISESVFDLPENSGQLKTRWGLVPAHGTVDPAAVDALGEPSWLLDLDAFLAKSRELKIEAVLNEARGFAERIYSVFRWAVTDEFLQRFGGEI